MEKRSSNDVNAVCCDDETQNIYLRNRYYNPSNGRFITEDPAQDGLNWYVYCGNNPINRIDPLGLEWGKVSDFISSYGGWKSSEVYRDGDGEEFVTITIPDLGVYDYHFYFRAEAAIDEQGNANMERIDFLKMLGVPYKDTTIAVNVDDKYADYSEKMFDTLVSITTFTIGGEISQFIGSWAELLNLGVGVGTPWFIDSPRPELGYYTEQYITPYKYVDYNNLGWILIPAYTTYEIKRDGERIEPIVTYQER